MADLRQSSCRFQKYRYSIPQLIELSATARHLFDLSKFSYEAARAGVVPSLGDCAMSSRKSSAGCTRVSNVETASNSDLLIFQGNRIVRPDRQPSLPPPTERQKDEGFARFLRKHSSPTHNRVTAGGRIVPMEPRSPPIFSLPSNVTNRPQAQTFDQQAQETTKKNQNNSWSSVSQPYQAQEDSMFNGLSPAEHMLECGTGLGAGQSTVYQSSTNFPIPYDIQMATTALPNQGVYPSPTHVVASIPQVGTHTIQQPVQYPQYALNSHYNGAMPNWGMTMPNDQYNSATMWSTYNHGLVQQPQMHQVMSPLQLLAAWEQHYADLDQQLKNIDRHRAMHNLDPQLAEQRRVIVQQRSDAKDFVKEYQAQLGIRRHFESSQESWTTAFNVDAPAYVPKSSVGFDAAVKPKPSHDSNQNMLLVEKPRGQSYRRAIPIKPPPEDYGRSRPVQQGQVQDQDRESVKAGRWNIQEGTTQYADGRNLRDLSEVALSEEMRKMSIAHQAAYTSESQDVASMLDMPCEHNPEFDRGRFDEKDNSNELVRILPADEKPPRDIQDEYQRLIEAVSQPKGTLTKVRLLDSRVIDVEGQGLGLISTHSLANEQLSNMWPNAGSTRETSSLVPVRKAHRSATPSSHFAIASNFTNKENVSVTPRGHEKAATEAFLAQFNAVEDNMALATRPATQSMRTASNGHTGLGSVNSHSTDKLSRSFESYKVNVKQAEAAYSLQAQDSGVADMNLSASPDALSHKGYSSVMVQNIHAIGSLPNNYDGAIEARQSVQNQLAAVNKSKSPRFLRRQGGKGGAWYGPYCRDVVEKAMSQNSSRGPARAYFH